MTRLYGLVRASFLSTPSAGRATSELNLVTAQLGISIHALRGEGDECLFADVRCGQQFLSTPSAGRATRRESGRSSPDIYFYPRPPRGGRPTTRKIGGGANSFLSTPSAGRATGHHLKRKAAFRRFLSTPSAGRATVCISCTGCKSEISIHALRGEGDGVWHCPDCNHRVFLSTPSAGRATSRPRR